MGYIDDTFAKLKHNLGITQTEQDLAKARHAAIRDFVRLHWDLADDFLTGSYRLDTKTKKLKDIDIFVVLDAGGSQTGFRDQAPIQVINSSVTSNHCGSPRMRWNFP
jgi:tRNA nucleotidyltransferase (CCA-adding enzyme)